MLLIVDAMASGLTFNKGNIFALHLQEGFKQVGDLIVNKRLQIVNYKFLVLMCRRADLWDLNTQLKQDLAYCINAIRNVNNAAIVVLTATLPQPTDQPNLIKMASYHNRYMSQLAADGQRLEFSRPGKHLLQLGKCMLDFFDEYHNLNEKGLDMIRRGLEAKFHCAKLQQKFEEFCHHK